MRAAACLLALGLGACAVSAEDCDPSRTGALLTAAACEVSGRYAERQARLEAGIRAREAEDRRVQEETQRRQAEAARLAGQRAAREYNLIGLQDELSAMEKELSAVRGKRAQEQVAIDALRRRSTGLRRRAASAPPDDAALHAEIKALEAEVFRRRQAIEAILKGAAAG